MAHERKVELENIGLCVHEFTTGNNNKRNEIFRTIKDSERLLETDNAYNPRPTHGPEIDDLDPVEMPVDDGFGNKGIDDGFLPESPERHPPRPSPGEFPYLPRVPDSIPGLEPRCQGGKRLPDVNKYQRKQIISLGMMNGALISANVHQFILLTSENPYYYAFETVIGLGLILQIVVYIGLAWNLRYDVNVDSQMRKADKVNNWTVIVIFLVACLHIFVASLTDFCKDNCKMSSF